MRKELLDLATKGQIAKTPQQIKKASKQVIQRLYAGHMKKISDGTVDLCSDSFIENVAHLAFAMGIANDKDALAKDLKKEKTFKADVNRMISYVLPWVPFVGLLAGAAVFAKHWFMLKTDSGGEEGPESSAGKDIPEAGYVDVPS